MSSFWQIRRAAPVLLGGLVLLGVLFHTEIAAAVGVWVSSTAYNYCFLIIPVALWLAWERRGLIEGVPVEPTLRALPVGLVLAIIWFVADRLGIMEGRQLAAMGFVQLLFFSVLGWPLYRRLAAPLLYLFFLVPVGAFLVPALQNFTTQFVAKGLNLLNIPNFVTGNTIEISAGVFQIARACAGLRFLIAAGAFSVFYALVIYRTLWRRIAFITVALFVPVIANGFRALGIVWLGHILGSAQAAAVDHVLYGYIFFSIVLLILIMLGLLFRQDRMPWQSAVLPTSTEQGSGQITISRVVLPCLVLMVFAGIGPVVASLAHHAAAAQRVSLPADVPGCIADPAPSIPPVVREGNGVLKRYSCANGTIQLSLVAFPPRSDPRPVVDTEQFLLGQYTNESIWESLTVPGAVPRIWRLVITKSPVWVTAAAVWMGGKPVDGGIRDRLHQALRELTGSVFSPVVLAVRTTPPLELSLPQLRRFIVGTLPSQVIARISRTAVDR